MKRLLLVLPLIAVLPASVGNLPEYDQVTNGVSLNRLATNRLATNRLATNRLATNRLATNTASDQGLTFGSETPMVTVTGVTLADGTVIRFDS